MDLSFNHSDFILSTFSFQDAVLFLEEIQEKWKGRVEDLSNRQPTANEQDKSNQWDLQDDAENAREATLDLMTSLQCDPIYK